MDDTDKRLKDILGKCVLCPRRCMVDRNNSEKGYCGAGRYPHIASAMPHHGEEPPISGIRGSGTIFFSNCNMKCLYCQNYQISQNSAGIKYSEEELAGLMLGLENKEVHNINLVSPTIWIKSIVTALDIARKKGLKIPVVYNTGGYDDPAILRLIQGYVDIYMLDMRYSDDKSAERYSDVKDYVKHNRASLKEMYSQVGPLVLDKEGVAQKGLLVRLLVLPFDISGIRDTLDFIRSELSTDIYLSIMAQYHPAYRASSYRQLARPITRQEYRQVTEYSEKLGFKNGWTQDDIFLEDDEFIPDFSDEDVFKYYKKDK